MSSNKIYKGCSLCEQCGRQAKHNNGIILSVIWTINTVEWPMIVQKELSGNFTDFVF